MQHMVESVADEESMGVRIRSRRQQLGMTLLDLASATGLTKSFVSQVERGRNSPSISTLRSIAGALDVPMFYFFQVEQSKEPVVKVGERRIVKFPKLGIYYELLTPDLQRSIEMVELKLKAGQCTGEDRRSHKGEECAVVLRGIVEVDLAGIPYRLEPGDSIYIMPGQPHKVRNTGDEDAVVLSAITPPTF
jgi:transcriptional regulator with XRE-family HTH domain